ncbi:histidyl-tRNA synthetase family protein [Blastomonas sp. RAC04]|jgi:ATP phosphoribosyltransferase regulatory subunit|uniref:ATP phosphoribosyltransferase regulatory subunit n=1 Tax=Blastomonas TaxID=150203 RepID=UPI0006B89CC4|nr:MULTISPECIES: ATP phosphoribosyltransferase regulatory subunit [unclassified Blastomonas]AOG01097.1 histidyl-tRNA synthetase family protein [Blastomonas sp. RAC04]KPF77201.1 tRNA synthetase class II [Blastomonas sp. AAP25]
MSETNPDILPAGLADLLPPRAEQAARLTRSAMDVLAGHGYDRVSPPLVEYERSLAARMQGTGRQHLFRMVDPSSMRTLAIRSDITVQVGRVATTLMASAPRPLRLSYAGQVLRIASDQLNPERERLQIGAELIGHDNIAAAQEVVRIAIEALAEAGVTGITVDLTLPDLVDTLAGTAFPLPQGQISSVRRELDMKDAGGLTALGADAYLPLLYAMGPFEAAIDSLAAIDAGGVLASRITALRQIVAALPDDVTVTLDPTERHGFEYQSWFGFSLYADGCAGVLGRGGTYAIPDGKGGEEVATGFSLYPDALLDMTLTGEQGAAGKLFLPLGHDQAVAARLRAIGWRTLAAITDADDAVALGCSHRLQGSETVAL